MAMAHPDRSKTGLAEMSNRINYENVDFQQYLLRCEPSIPNDYYTDKIFKNEFLNSSVIRVNKLVVFLFYNCINATLQSSDTVIRRRMFQAFETANRKGSSHEGKKLSGRGANKVERDAQQDAQLSFPNRNVIAFTTLITLQLVLWLHYALGFGVLINPLNKKYAITTSKNLQTIQTLVAVENELVSLQASKWSSEASSKVTSCLSYLERYIFEQYDKFYVWNMSVSLVFSGPIMDDFLLVEQNVSLQMFSDEVVLFCHTLGFFLITSGLMGCVLAECKPYNVAPLAFIYDPRYSAYHIKSRIRYYFNIMRLSYKNYWSIYHIDQDDGLCKCLSNSQSRLTQMAELSSSKPSSVYHPEQFEDYIPSARGPAWRRVLIIANPIYQIVSSALVTVTLGLLYLFFVSGNDQATDLNHELKHFLQTGAEPPGLGQVISEFCVNVSSIDSDTQTMDGSRERLSSYVRWKMIEYFSGLLRRFSPDLSMLKLHALDSWSSREDLIESFSLPPSTKIWITTKPVDYEHDSLLQMHKRLVVTAIEPTKRPTLTNWSIPYLGGLISGLLFSLYFAIFFSVIADLCFWLFEIRMKLDTCKSLLKLDKKRTRAKVDDQQVLEHTFDSHKSLVARLDQRWPLELEALNDEPEEVLLESSNSGMSSSLSTWSCLDESLAKQYYFLANDKQLCSSRSPIRAYALRRRALSSVRSFDTYTFGTTNLPNFPTSKARSDDYARSLYDTRRPRAEKSTLEDRKLRREAISNCNTGFWEVIEYVISSRSKQRAMCAAYAQNIIRTDSRLHAMDPSRECKQSAYSFLLSTYLDFRLFLEQIETCRFSINFMLSFTVLHALNIIASSQFTDLMRSKIGFLACGYVLANVTLMGSSFFQSQCTKLISPIYSILASSLDGNKTIKHLSSLWRRALVDLSGSRSKLSFRVYSVNISYATALQFNLGVTSLYILTLDKMRYRV